MCQVGFYRRLGSCVQCPDHGWLLVALFAAAVIIVGALLGFLFRHALQPLRM